MSDREWESYKRDGDMIRSELEDQIRKLAGGHGTDELLRSTLAYVKQLYRDKWALAYVVYRT